MKKKLLIYGAGAIGRGFVPWIFGPDEYEFYYVETNDKLRDLLNERKRFATHRTVNGEYQTREISLERAFRLGEEKEVVRQMDAVITAVGPRNIFSIAGNLKGIETPVITCENDFAAPESLSYLTGNKNVVFGIPDVITSNTAPPELKKKDLLSIVTEDGVCFADKRAEMVGGSCRYVDSEELKKQWFAKLYLHNTPHCIAAYLGSLVGGTYVHEGMQNPRVKNIVEGAMREMQAVLVSKMKLDEGFITWYADKELQRFSNVLLFDPLIRVAREPFRKLAANERLIGAAHLCLSVGVIPQNIMLGIMAAFYYNNSNDPDANIQHLVGALEPRDFLRVVMNLPVGSTLYELLVDNWSENLRELKSLK